MAHTPDEADRTDPLGTGNLDVPPVYPEGVTPAPNAQAGPNEVNVDGGSAASSPDEEIEATRAQIEQTRGEMSETIDAIQEKLSPENLKEQAKDTIKQATVEKVEEATTVAASKASQAVSSASETLAGAGPGAPRASSRTLLPVALIGVAAAGLLIGMRRRQLQNEREKQASQDGVQVWGRLQQRAGELGGQARDRAGRAREKAAPDKGTTGQVKERVAQVQERVAWVARRGKAQVTEPAPQEQPLQALGALFEDTDVAAIDVLAGLGVVLLLTVLRRAKKSNWL